MPLFYADASALVKLVREEPETAALNAFLDDADLVSSAVSEPVLRALDAIHVVAALDLSPVDAFVSYDQRQSAAARLAGLRTVAPAAAA